MTDPRTDAARRALRDQRSRRLEDAFGEAVADLSRLLNDRPFVAGLGGDLQTVLEAVDAIEHRVNEVTMAREAVLQNDHVAVYSPLAPLDRYASNAQRVERVAQVVRREQLGALVWMDEHNGWQIDVRLDDGAQVTVLCDLSDLPIQPDGIARWGAHYYPVGGNGRAVEVPVCGSVSTVPHDTEDWDADALADWVIRQCVDLPMTHHGPVYQTTEEVR